MSTDEAAATDGFAAPRQGKALTFDTSVANQARIYDYVLGGKDNFEADRVAAAELIRIWPEMAFAMRANRAFLGRAVRYLAAEAGIRQFLDVGTGIPTAGNTHQIAQEVAPESRVVYADYDPIVLAQARALLTSGDAGATEYIHADLRDTAAILSQARELLDFSKPVAVTLVAILHAIPDDDDPHAVVAELLDALPSGSYLALTHFANDSLDAGTQSDVQAVIDRMVQQRITPRSRQDVARFFAGLDLVEPGIVALEDWRPLPTAQETAKSSLWCGVGRKR